MSREILGACYIKETEATLGNEIWELGGVRVAPSVRGKGLFQLLGMTALVSTILTCQPQGVLLAHVLSRNEGPRKTLLSLGFNLTEEKVRLNPDDFPGFSHIDPDADANGVILADTYMLPRERYHHLLETALDFQNRTNRQTRWDHINIRAQWLDPTVLQDALAMWPDKTSYEPL